ncbi:hypothetical protein [Chryseobacterium sp. SC28]|uniref:hypothetical protein n=1 Tax=Chryseobacterium sp. SC28 TaxID=2268028 RepID=UPI001E35B06A|nr:hypothetical protein [Chryseobacterium sp. SC28]
MNFLKKLFGKAEKPVAKEFSEEYYELDYERKLQGLENVLGKMHNLVGHAIIPFSVGGAVDKNRILAARLEWKFFFVAGKAWAKRLGTEGGKAAQIIIKTSLIDKITFQIFCKFVEKIQHYGNIRNGKTENYNLD